MCWIRIGDVDRQQRVAGGGGVGGDGVVAGDRGGLGAEGGELAGQSVDLCIFISVYPFIFLLSSDIPQLPALSRIQDTARRR